jgi:hypothetical protein
MIFELESLDTPTWLETVKPNDELPLHGILERSLFYGAAGLDETPVRFLAGNVHSFVYADYSVSKHDFLADLLGRGRDSGFRTYRQVFSHDVPLEELWPADYRQPIPRPQNMRLISSESPERWAHWSVWECTHEHRRFSFLYIGAEQSDVYQNVYNRLGHKPHILSIIAPGNGLGGGWESCDSVGSHYHTVASAGSAGTPDYLLYGGNGGPHYYEKPCWPEMFAPQKICRLSERYATLFAAHPTSS